MKLFVINENFSPIEKKLGELNSLNHTIINVPMVINFDGRNIDIEALKQIESRDPNNNYIILLKQEVFKQELELIKKTDGIILLNGNNSNLSIQTIMKLTIASYLNKIIIFEQKVTKEIFSKIRNYITIILLNGDFSKISTILPNTKRLKLTKVLKDKSVGEIDEMQTK